MINPRARFTSSPSTWQGVGYLAGRFGLTPRSTKDELGDLEPRQLHLIRNRITPRKLPCGMAPWWSRRPITNLTPRAPTRARFSCTHCPARTSSKRISPPKRLQLFQRPRTNVSTSILGISRLARGSWDTLSASTWTKISWSSRVATRGRTKSSCTRVIIAP